MSSPDLSGTSINFSLGLRDKLTSVVRTYSVRSLRFVSFCFAFFCFFHCGPGLPAPLTPMRVFILRRLNRSLWSGILTIKTPTTLSTGPSASPRHSWLRAVSSRNGYIFDSDLMEGKCAALRSQCSSKNRIS